MASTKSKAASQSPAVDAAPQEQTILVGRLTADPRQPRLTKNGKAVSSICIAVNNPPETTFHSVVVWGWIAEVVGQFITRGRLVEVTGRPQQSTYPAFDGPERSVSEIVAWRLQYGQKVSSPSVTGEVV